MRGIALLFVLVFLFGAPARAGDALRVVLLPYTNTVALLGLYQPLRHHLSERLGRPVELYTAVDHPAHFTAIQDQDYDLAITAPHFGAWAVTHGAVPLFRYRPFLTPIIAVRADSPISGPEDLKGKTVVLSNPVSTSSLGGKSWLLDHGLESGRDYKEAVRDTHTTALMAVVLGEADGAITTHTPLVQAPRDIQDKLRVLESPIHLPHLFTIANPALPAIEVATIRDALLSFEASPEGRNFFLRSGYVGYDPISDGDIEALLPFVALAGPAAP
jgi:phosphonate transport system substrate-binding protein